MRMLTWCLAISLLNVCSYDHDTKRNDRTGQDDEKASLLWSGTFALPCRNGRSDLQVRLVRATLPVSGQAYHSVTYPANHPTSTEKAVVESSGLHNGPNNHDQASPKCRGLPSPTFTIEQDEYRPKEASDLIDGYTGCLRIRSTSTHVWIRLAAIATDPAQVVGFISRGHHRQHPLEVV